MVWIRKAETHMYRGTYRGADLAKDLSAFNSGVIHQDGVYFALNSSSNYLLAVTADSENQVTATVTCHDHSQAALVQRNLSRALNTSLDRVDRDTAASHLEQAATTASRAVLRLCKRELAFK